MLHDILSNAPAPVRRVKGWFVIETERLTLRGPTQADIPAITKLANDRGIAEMTRWLPHPYLIEHAAEFVATLGRRPATTFAPLVSLARLRARSPISRLRNTRSNSCSRARAGSQSGVAQRAREMRLQCSGVELHRFESLGSSSPVDCFRLSRNVWTSLRT